MQPSDLSQIVTVETPVVLGPRVVYVRATVDVPGDRTHRELWLHDGTRDRRLTLGPSDSKPAWSPAGDRIAFIRGDDDTSWVAMIAPDGGEAEPVAEFPLGVRELVWSPDGQTLAAVAVTWSEDWDGLDEEERGRRPRRLTRVPYRADGLGWTHDRRTHVWLVDPDGGEEPRCLTPGDFDERGVAWSPDGTRVAFLSDRDERRGLAPGTDVWEVEVDTGATTRAVPERGNWHVAGYRPDGLLHLLGRPDPSWPAVLGLHRRERDGTLTHVAPDLDRSLLAVTGEAPPLRWLGDRCVTSFEDAGRVSLVAISPVGEVDHVVTGRRVVSGFDVSDDDVVFAASTTTSPADLYRIGPGGERRLTDGTVDLPVVEPDHFRVESGGEEIDVWVYLPPGEERVPVLLNIHGGPAAQYGFGFLDELQVYAGAGYGVVVCNPRGSSGRGEAFVQAVTGQGWGVVDHADVLAALDAALERHRRLDPDRQGVMGGSYGGFLTAWLLAREDRFSSAVVERALVSWTSFAGTSDIAANFPSDYTSVAYPDAWERWWEASPLATAHLIDTPTLIIHSEQDHRCPIEQAEQLFMALLRNGTDTELLRFPGEGHELSRSGSPRHRLERFEAILDWHGRHLG